MIAAIYRYNIFKQKVWKSYNLSKTRQKETYEKSCANIKYNLKLKKSFISTLTKSK